MEETLQDGLVVMEQARREIRLGYFSSLFFILIAVVSLFRAMVWPKSFNQEPLPISLTDGTFVSLLLSINTDLLVFFLAVLFLSMSIFAKPADGWEGWSVLWTGPVVVCFFSWLSVMDGILRILVYVTFLCCSLYAFLTFRSHLKGPVSRNH